VLVRIKSLKIAHKCTDVLCLNKRFQIKFDSSIPNLEALLLFKSLLLIRPLDVKSDQTKKYYLRKVIFKEIKPVVFIYVLAYIFTCNPIYMRYYHSSICMYMYLQNNGFIIRLWRLELQSNFSPKFFLTQKSSFCLQSSIRSVSG
jgi:hypothetical protein